LPCRRSWVRIPSSALLLLLSPSLLLLRSPLGEFHLLSKPAYAGFVGWSERWVRERVRKGKLMVVRLDGGALAFELEDLLALADTRRIGGDAELRVVHGERWREAS
jgi:hypothetical protein